ncbi:MAG: ABC transporter ATP-binding protein [Atopobiaceae bacterium]|nr:ABC transporter ATP-binding protein [Atopobiaceae bacterium]
MEKTIEAEFEHSIETEDGKVVQFCSLEERKLAQKTAQEQREEQCKKNVLLDVNNLDITLFTEDGKLPAVSDLSFIMRKGETLAVVGESGCGKSMTALSVMGLLPNPPAKITGGEILFEGTDLASLSRDEMRKFRGERIGMIFQEPMTSLNPVMKSGHQIREGILVHNPHMSKQEADKQALDMIKLVGIPAPEKVFSSYPHELSGGMRQRVMIAMALACQPSLLICDEPTTALDVTVQAQILQIIDRMKQDLGTAVMLITHDMGVVSEMADWVLVMYAGHRVEYAQAAELFTNPLHPYSQGLIASIPSFDERTDKLYAIPGSVPMLSHMPSGCPFHPRCPFAKDICKKCRPGLTAVGDNDCHTVSCWKYTDKWGE